MLVIIGLNLHEVRYKCLKLIFKPVSNQEVEEDDPKKLKLDPVKKLLTFLAAIA